ncbi:MAG: FadR/GntR family transcriptional regulator [Rhodovibrionaceae bacterium]|nr:FadR/GntR family transcriptional regulator [Rhodovibrionaceae bacterium]
MSSAGEADPRFQAIERERVSDRVAQELMRLIASGRLAPGERLPGERQLADMMNVSRVSIRAALQQLKAQGFVQAIQGGGTRIIASTEDMEAALTKLVRHDVDNLHDLAEIRVQLESWAARRAAERADDTQIAEIEAKLRAMQDPHRHHRHKAEDDLAFHLAIAKAAGSSVYLHLMGVLGDILEEMLAFHRYTLSATEADDRAFLSQHEAVFAAIAARDGEAAARAMQDHLLHVLRRYERYDEDGRDATAELSAQAVGRAGAG